MLMAKLRSLVVRKNRDERGFTMVELLMVTAIIGVLAGIGMQGFGTIKKRALTAKADSYWRMLKSAVQMYNMDEDTYPAIASGTSAAASGTDLANYLDQSDEPWNTATAWGSTSPPTDADTTTGDFQNAAKVRFYMVPGSGGNGGNTYVWVSDGTRLAGSARNGE